MKKTAGGGLVIDGAIRDLEGIASMDMAAYFRGAHPTAIRNVMLTGFNIPVRIGSVTVLPGDIAFGDREGIYFVPPQFAEDILTKADETHVHDEWTKKKFDEGKYKSSDIYGSPREESLKKEYKEYLEQRLPKKK
jgi:regulator of RNase E activity RraA